MKIGFTAETAAYAIVMNNFQKKETAAREQRFLGKYKDLKSNAAKIPKYGKPIKN